MNKPRPLYNKAGELIGYKVEVKWRKKRRYFTRRTLAAAEVCWANAIADFEANREPYDRYKETKPAPEVKPVTFGEWLDEWHPRRRLGAQTRLNQGYYIKARIKPYIGHLPLVDGKITKPDIQGWIWELEEEYAPRYVRTVFGVASLALGDAIDDPAIPLTANPAARIRFEEKDATGRRALTPEQVAAVASRCGIHSTLIWTLPFTGMRIGEAIKRDVTDWSWRTGITIAGRPVEVDETKARQRKKGTKKAKASKTAAGARTVDLCTGHAAMIRDYIGDRRSGPLFVGRFGQRPRYHTVYETVINAAAAARAAGIEIPEGFSPHWLRKTARTWSSEDKIQRIAIDYRIGHATPGMEGIYEDPTRVMLDDLTAGLQVRWVQAMAAPGRLLAKKTA